jgi:hypothetical protein
MKDENTISNYNYNTNHNLNSKNVLTFYKYIKTNTFYLHKVLLQMRITGHDI